MRWLAIFGLRLAAAMLLLEGTSCDSDKSRYQCFNGPGTCSCPGQCIMDDCCDVRCYSTPDLCGQIRTDLRTPRDVDMGVCQTFEQQDAACRKMTGGCGADPVVWNSDGWGCRRFHCVACDLNMSGADQ